MSWYLHLDMDAFYASVEQAVNPALKDKPVIVGGKGGKGVVTSASYEARKFGVHSAMPGFQAKQLCPQGIFLANRRRLYSEYSKKVFALLEQYSPAVDAVSIDEGVVDLTGTEKLLGPPLSTAERIIQRIKAELDLPASAGLSTSRVVAKIAATLAKPHGLIHILEGSEKIFLSSLPVSLVPGVGPKAQGALLQRGIKTIGDLLQHQELRNRFFDLDAADDHRRVRDHSIGNETTLDKPLQRKEEMEKVLWELAEEVGKRLRRERYFARCITVKIRYSDFKTITRSRTLAAPTCFDRQIFEVAGDLLRKNVSPGHLVRLLGITASALLSAGWQESLFDVHERGSLEKLYRGIDRLREKYGQGAIGAATPRTRTR
jgi:DNA polymerase IV